ncbi:ADP-ribosylation factor-like protein 13A isoform X2 [Mixophyes fleayi]|uniref:ADP-ribosylation factor-like protein 13A isoform X2 n=1 Tax=Mixophyes fleayi TaxID=3061075 RepID=UPI003F4D92EB
MEGAVWTSKTQLQHLTMFHLFSHCWRWVQIKQEPIKSVTILFMGLENAGKSSVIRVIKKVPQCPMYSGSDPFKTELRLDQFDLTLLELPSGQKARANWRLYYPHAHALVFVVDASDPEHIQEVSRILASILKHPRVAGKPLLILANKQDRAGALLPSEIIELLSLEKLVNENKTLCRIEPCSAITDFRIHHDWAILKALRWVLRSVTLSYSTLSARILQESAEQKDSMNQRASLRPQKDSNLSRWEVLHDSITDLVEYKAFPSGKKSPLKPFQNILTQTGSGYNLQSLKKTRRKVRVKETGCPHNFNVDGWEKGEPGAEAKKSPSREAQLCRTAGHKTVITPDTKDNIQATSEDPKKRKKKRKSVSRKQIKSLEAGTSAGDMGNTFELYRRAMHALKLKQEQQRERPIHSKQGVSPLQ